MLFDREQDPLEINNVVGQTEYAAVEAKVRGYLDDWVTRIPDDGPQQVISKR